MLFRLAIVVCFLLALGGCQRESYSRSVSGFSSLDKKVLYDFREEVNAPHGIARTYDLNGDGKQEHLLVNQERSQEGMFRDAKLVRFDKDKLITIEDFGRVFSDPCAAGNAELTASVLYYLPPPKGQSPRFVAEIYHAPCTKEGQERHWARAGSP